MASIVGRVVRVIKDPMRIVRRYTARAYLPLWLRKFLGRVLPPYSGYSKMRSVYVVTYGRSGSTLLTRYLTHLPGVDLKGENYLFPLPAMEAEQKLRDSRQKPYKGRENPESPWYGSHQFTPKRWRRDIADAMLNQLYPSRPIPKKKRSPSTKTSERALTAAASINVKESSAALKRDRKSVV